MVQAPTHPAGKVKVWTYDDYLRLPENGSPELLTYISYEILEGELIVSPAPRVNHQRISINLATFLNLHVKEHDLGEVFHAPIDVVLDPQNIPQPDLVFVSKERAAIVTEENIQGPPDLLVEIISPTSDRRDRVRKFETYARFGVTYYWIVDPVSKTIEEYFLQNAVYESVRDWQMDDTFTPQLFPEFSLSLRHIF